MGHQEMKELYRSKSYRQALSHVLDSLVELASHLASSQLSASNLKRWEKPKHDVPISRGSRTAYHTVCVRSSTWYRGIPNSSSDFVVLAVGTCPGRDAFGIEVDCNHSDGIVIMYINLCIRSDLAGLWLHIGWTSIIFMMEIGIIIRLTCIRSPLGVQLMRVRCGQAFFAESHHFCERYSALTGKQRMG